MRRRKIKFDANKVFLYGLCYTCEESKKDWIERTIELKNVDFNKHPTNLEEFLSIEADTHDVFNFQRSMNVEVINKETKAIDRKAHLFWEIPVIDSKISTFMDSISSSRDASRKLMMTADTKDAKTFFSIKKYELEQHTTLELSFVESIFMMYKLRKKNCKSKS